MRRLIPFVALLALTGCGDSNDPLNICDAALQGALLGINYADRERSCQIDVWTAQHSAGYRAAQKYRELPR